MVPVIAYDVIMAQAVNLMLPFARISAFVVAAPMIDSTTIPPQIKVILSLFLAMVVLPMIEVPAGIGWNLGSAILLVQQLIIGFAMALALRVVFGLVHVAGQMIAQQMGLGFAAMQDPQNGVQVPIVSRFYSVFLILLFMAINGHLVIIEILIESFTNWPLTAGLPPHSVWQTLIEWTALIFSGGLQMALPAVIVLLMVNMSFGVVTRAAPQLNILVVGFPISLMVGLILIVVTLGSIGVQMEGFIADVLLVMRGLVNG